MEDELDDLNEIELAKLQERINRRLKLKTDPEPRSKSPPRKNPRGKKVDSSVYYFETTQEEEEKRKAEEKKKADEKMKKADDKRKAAEEKQKKNPEPVKDVILSKEDSPTPSPVDSIGSVRAKHRAHDEEGSATSRTTTEDEFGSGEKIGPKRKSGSRKVLATSDPPAKKNKEIVANVLRGPKRMSTTVKSAPEIFQDEEEDREEEEEQPLKVTKQKTVMTPNLQQNQIKKSEPFLEIEDVDEKENEDEKVSKKSKLSKDKTSTEKRKKEVPVQSTKQIFEQKDAPPPPETEPAKALVRYNYRAQHDDELTIFRNDIVTVLFEKNSDWWMVSLSGKTGLVPSNYLVKREKRKKKKSIS